MENIGSGDGMHWWWALASATQLAWGIRSYRIGYTGDSHVMPFKAFAVASLFVGGAATASIGVLHFSGIREVEDLIEVGANLRNRLGIPRRTGDK